MANKDFILSLDGVSALRLRTISRHDIENLRTWKNRNKGTCFLNQDISPEQQEIWFVDFISREDDYMFIAEQFADQEWKAIGCMGFRKLEQERCIDAYNIIRARKIQPASFTLGDAFCMMLAYAHSLFDKLPLQSKVLKTNPAIEWYKKNHFSIASTGVNYYLMEINKEGLKKYNWIKNA
jgi:hypothetical protein